MSTSRRLHVAVHDVAPCHFARLRQIDALLAELGVGDHYSMLVVPNFHRRGPLRADREFARWLRARADAGVEMVLHGYYHLDETSHRRALSRFKASAMTAREGEFLGLDLAEARRRLEQGREEVAAVVGQQVEGFVAPAWLYSADTHQALRDAGFRFAENHLRVWSPVLERTLVRSPVVSYASRSRWRRLSSIGFSKVARRALSWAPVLRLGIHPYDIEHASLVDETRRVLIEAVPRRRRIRFADMLEG